MYSFGLALSEIQETFHKVEESSLVNEIQKIGEDMIETITDGQKIITFGNGGSAAEASHLVTELISKCTSDHEPWQAICLNDSTSNITAIGNDYGFNEVFARQSRALVMPGDCVLAFSTSGKSQNIISALETASEISKKVYLLTGTGYLHKESAKWQYIQVPSSKTTHIQEVHLWIIHVLSEFCEAYQD